MEILDNFYRALQISGENSDLVTEDLMKTYISRVFARVIASYEDEAKPEASMYYGKAMQKIPKWAKNSNFGLHKMISAYLTLAEKGDVTYSAYSKLCSNEEEYPEFYVKNFVTNFTQMSHDDKRSVGKIFEMKDGIITLWSYMEPYIMMYKKDFLKG